MDNHSYMDPLHYCHSVLLDIDIDIDEETVLDRLNIHGGPSNASEHAGAQGSTLGIVVGGLGGGVEGGAE